MIPLISEWQDNIGCWEVCKSDSFDWDDFAALVFEQRALSIPLETIGFVPQVIQHFFLNETQETWFCNGCWSDFRERASVSTTLFGVPFPLPTPQGRRDLQLRILPRHEI